MYSSFQRPLSRRERGEPEISVAVEHLATAITERMLTLVHSTVSPSAENETIIVACVANEPRSAPDRRFMRTQRLAGDFSADTSISSLLKCIEERKPRSRSVPALPPPSLIQAIDA
jgi:hypothetical protein